MSRRGWAAVAILALWIAGLGMLARRELFRPDTERFAEMGLRVAPGATYYAVMRGAEHVGFASSTIDTTDTGIQLIDYLVADLPTDSGTHRTVARTNVLVSRGMRLREFTTETVTARGPRSTGGRVEGDSVMVYWAAAGVGTPADTQRIPIEFPLLMPSFVPLATALADEPEVGRTESLPVFDPRTGNLRDVPVRIAAESLFVLHDSSTYDPVSRRWVGALPDTTRGWQIVSADGPELSGWIDAQGRLVSDTRLGGLTLERMPYELAFQNWQLSMRDDTADQGSSDDEILESTVIAADVPVTTLSEELTVRLRGVDLTGFDLTSPRQQRRGDTLSVSIESASALTPRYTIGSLTRDMNRRERESWQRYLRSESLVETMDPDVRRLAMTLRGSSRNPRVVAARINEWVHDSLARQPSAGVPSARAVLAARAGDANEHTQLYVALARAAGIPARAAAGLLHVDGRFYSHAWPEVYLGDWVAVDPALGQFPADASHLRFVVGGLERQADLLRLMDNLEIDVLEP